MEKDKRNEIKLPYWEELFADNLKKWLDKNMEEKKELVEKKDLSNKEQKK